MVLIVLQIRLENSVTSQPDAISNSETCGCDSTAKLLGELGDKSAVPSLIDVLSDMYVARRCRFAGDFGQRVSGPIAHQDGMGIRYDHRYPLLLPLTDSVQLVSQY